MTIRIRHNLAQRATCDSTVRSGSKPRTWGVTIPDSQIPATASTQSVPDGNTAQLNLTAIQRFLLSAPPPSPFTARFAMQNQPDSSHGMDIKRAGLCWTPRLISTGEQSPAVNSSARSKNTVSRGGSRNGSSHQIEPEHPTIAAKDTPANKAAAFQNPEFDDRKNPNSTSVTSRELRTAGRSSSRLLTAKEPI